MAGLLEAHPLLELQGAQRGDRVFFEPGEDHWHGAAPGRFMTHISMQETDDSGSPVAWGEHVTDEEYGAAPAS
jgi:quercetin dioxygenase-like cupin family protein